jgi:hypothetical protein
MPIHSAPGVSSVGKDCFARGFSLIVIESTFDFPDL